MTSERRSDDQQRRDSDSVTQDSVSLTTLKEELSMFMDRKDSTPRWLNKVYPGTERLEYDFTMERQNLYGNNLVESVAHLIKGCLGAGILGMHEGYMRGGIWTSLGVTFVIGIIVTYTMYMLVSSAQKLYVRLRIPRLTYPDLMEAAVATGPIKKCRKYSRAFRYLVDICLFVQLCGACCIYQIMIARTFKQTLEGVSTVANSWNLSIRVYILMITVLIFALCMIRNLKYLAPFCLIADIFVGICVITTMYYSISVAGDLKERPAFKSFTGLLEFCGILFFSIDGVFIVLPVENSMDRPRYINTVLYCGMTVVLLAVTLTGFFGYWGWGESCQSPITIHMPVQGFPIALEFLLIVILAITFAINFWVPFRVVWRYVGRRFLRRRGLWERFCRAIQVLLITCISIGYPNLINIMIVLGNFFLAFIAFIFPAFIESLVTWHEPRKCKIRWRLIKNVLFVLIGLTLVISVFII